MRIGPRAHRVPEHRGVRELHPVADRQRGAATAGRVHFSGLPGGTWSLVQTCVEASASHTNLRVQFYPTVGSPTLEIDDVNVNESLAVNGSFDDGSGAPWKIYPGSKSNYTIYGNSPGAPPAYAGSHFAAINTSSSGGGLIQDIPLKTSAGQTVCGSAELRTEFGATGASGRFALWLVGGARPRERLHRLFRPGQRDQLDPGPDVRRGHREPHQPARPVLSDGRLPHRGDGRRQCESVAGVQWRLRARRLALGRLPGHELALHGVRQRPGHADDHAHLRPRSSRPRSPPRSPRRAPATRSRSSC